MVEPQLARKKSGLFRSLTAKASKVIHGADIDTQVRPQRAGTLRARARREMDGSTRQMQMQGRPRTTSESSVTIDPMTGIGSDGVDYGFKNLDEVYSAPTQQQQPYQSHQQPYQSHQLYDGPYQPPTTTASDCSLPPPAPVRTVLRDGTIIDEPHPPLGLSPQAQQSTATTSAFPRSRSGPLDSTSLTSNTNAPSARPMGRARSTSQSNPYMSSSQLQASLASAPPVPEFPRRLDRSPSMAIHQPTSGRVGSDPNENSDAGTAPRITVSGGEEKPIGWAKVKRSMTLTRTSPRERAGLAPNAPDRPPSPPRQAAAPKMYSAATLAMEMARLEREKELERRKSRMVTAEESRLTENAFY